MATITTSWSEQSARYLLATSECPRCRTELVVGAVCGQCRADLRGPEGAAVLDASRRAAEALREREGLIALLPTAPADAVEAAAAASVAVPDAPGVPNPQGRAVAAAPTTASATLPTHAAAAPTSQVSVQSVLAVAGAGLLAIAAIVFVFLNPDVGFAMRTTVIAAMTVLFLGGAWLLRRRDVRFSAEAIGALGMGFLALDVQAFAEAAPDPVSGWVLAGIGTFVASAVMLVVGWRARIRSWLWVSFVGLALVPAFFGYGAGGWGTAWGHIGVVAVALAAHELVARLEPRFGGTLRADRVTLTVLQLAATVVVLFQLPFLEVAVAPGSGATAASAEVLGRALLLVVLAGLAALAARNEIARFWSFAAGAIGATAVVLLPFAIERLDGVWLLTLAPLAAALVLAASGLVRGIVPRPRPFQSGALTITLLAAVPAAATAFGTFGVVVSQFGAAVLAQDAFNRAGTTLLTADDQLAGALGLFAAALGAALLAWQLRRTATAGEAGTQTRFAGMPGTPMPGTPTAGTPMPGTPTAGTPMPFAVGLLGLALWLGAIGTSSLIAWSGLLPLTQTLVGVAVAVIASGAVLVPWSRFALARAGIRAPIIVLAHVALVEAALISWVDDAITVPVGVVIAGALLVVARTLPVIVRPAHLAVAYAYGLVLLATALDRAGVITIAVLCLTTAAAALFALAATLVRRVDAPSWYAILLVTTVPFLLGVASVLGERSGWTALSTAVIFALALTLVLTRRPGLNRFVRSAAAALLVPALAVVVVCLSAEWLASSGSPVALPIIAGIVAVALPSTAAIEVALERHGLRSPDAASARLWIEISTLVTAAIMVALALGRDAAGLETTIVVLVVLGLGAAATSIFAGRRYGWWLAGASWTGALWSVLALVGVDVVEPYTLPPAVAAAVVATVLVARRGRGRALFASALGVAIVPSLIALAAFGSGNASADGAADGLGVGSVDAGWPWRTVGLLAGAVLLAVLGRVLVPRDGAVSRRLVALRVPALAAAVLAAAAGPIQGVRFGLERDPLPIDATVVMVPALALALVATVVALATAVFARAATEWSAHSSRWLSAPAVAYLVVGPIFAIRRDWFSIWTLWALMAVLLVVAVAMVGVAVARKSEPWLPPFWFVYAAAWITGVAGWSQRDLRVEVFSLPLGLAVLAAGVIAMRPRAAEFTTPSLNSWPIGFRGSWRLLAPGIVLTLLPSVLATGTDPQLYRPILVIALALIAILVGATRKLAAPFILGLAVLPIENIVVFAAQIDRTVGAMPWWITLATAGAVLLAIAVGSERRTSQGRGVGAMLRELE